MVLLGSRGCRLRDQLIHMDDRTDMSLLANPFKGTKSKLTMTHTKNLCFFRGHSKLQIRVCSLHVTLC